MPAGSVAVAADARQAWRRSSEASPNTAQLLAALAATRQQLGAARSEIGALRIQDSLLKEQVAALEQAVASAHRFAHRDALTGLPNRHLLLDRFHQAAAQCERQHKRAVLLFLDLDGFKRVNDTFGHLAGDSLLQQVAARLTACIRASDTASRVGGDEFVVLLPEIDGEQNAAAVTQKIRAHLAVPYVIAGTEIELRTSIGMAVYPADGKEYGDLVHVSDREMYQNKSAGSAAPSAIEPRRLRGGGV